MKGTDFTGMDKKEEWELEWEEVVKVMERKRLPT